MAKLTYINNMSLDGYIEDRHGAFDFGPVSDDVLAVYTDLLRTVGTFLYGRRLYEMMAVWETMPALAAQSSLAADFSNAWKAPARSSTPRPWRRRRQPTPGSNEPSTSPPCNSSRPTRAATSPWEAPTSHRRPSTPASSTNASCSSGR